MVEPARDAPRGADECPAGAGFPAAGSALPDAWRALPGAALRAARLGVFGGSFDPPHRGHLFVARRALVAAGLERVLFVPAARPPHKPERRLAGPLERWRMLLDTLAAAGDEPFDAWGVELLRAGPSYTVDTLEELVRLRAVGAGPGARLALVIGADNLAGLPRWHQLERVLELARPVVVGRAGLELERELDGLAGELAPSVLAALRERAIDARFDASSTELRALDDPRGDERLVPAVAAYIHAQALYGRTDR